MDQHIAIRFVHSRWLGPISPLLRRWVGQFFCILAVGVLGQSTGFGQDTGAITGGNWNDGTTWTTGTVPDSSSNVYIGSTYPTGSGSTVTVTLERLAMGLRTHRV